MGPLRRPSAAPLAALAVLSVLFAWTSPSGAAASTDSGMPAFVSEAPPPDSADAAPRYRLDPIVVTAERSPVPLSDVPSDVTVLAGAPLDRDHLPLLADALRRIPSLDVQRAGSLGKLTDVRLRGADPRHTLVLFDGIPLNGPWAGTFDFADLPGAGWGQVEVMGGPASSLYGSGAVGGVIQILSPSGPGPDRFRAFAEVGETGGAGGWGTHRQGAFWSGTASGAFLGAGATRFASEGAVPRDAYVGASGRVHASGPFAGGAFRASGLFTKGTKEIPYDYRFDATDFSTRQVYDPNTEERDRTLAGHVLYGREIGRALVLEAEASAFAGRIDYENRPDAASGDYVDTRLDNARGIAALRARLAGRGPLQAVAGAEYREERVDREDDSQYGGFPTASTVEREVGTRSLYGQLHMATRRLLLDAGVRLEDHARYGARGVPRVALGVPIPRAGVKLRAGYGRAFTAPTLSDLYYPFYGSERLRPERSRTWEAGADGEWLGGRVEARVTWHTTRFRDLIQSNSYFQAENIGRARLEGEEYWLRLSPRRAIAITLHAAHLFAKRLDDPASTDNRLPKRPRWRAGIEADLAPAPGVGATAALRWVGSMFDPFAFHDVAGRFLSGDLPGYASLDLGGSVALGRPLPLELRLRVENVLDREHSEVRGYPALGRRVTAGIAFAR